MTTVQFQVFETARPISWQYLAGLIDGEASITISRRYRDSFSLKIDLGQIYYPVVIQLRDQFGGNWFARPGYNKPFYVWSVNGHRAAWILQNTREFLWEKQVQAWLALEYMAQRTLTHVGGGANSRALTSASEIALREGFALAMQSAKRVSF